MATKSTFFLAFCVDFVHKRLVLILVWIEFDATALRSANFPASATDLLQNWPFLVARQGTGGDWRLEFLAEGQDWDWSPGPKAGTGRDWGPESPAEGTNRLKWCRNDRLRSL